jgi:putative copper resistance protein D
MTEALPVLVLLAAVGLGYAAAVRTIWLRRSRHVVPPIRVGCFVLGLAVVAAALCGPLDDAADERFSLHMLQHTLLIFVAAPLLVLGTPVTVLLAALSPAHRRRTATPLLRSRPAQLALAPAFGLATFLAVLCGSHLPAVYDMAVSHQPLHDLEHVAYLLTAALFWLAVLGPDPRPRRLSHPARLLYLFVTMAAMAVVGAALSMSATPSYPYYAREARDHGYDALADQHTGGVLMWTTTMVVLVPAMAAVVLGWLAEDERHTARREQQLQGRVSSTSSAG